MWARVDDGWWSHPKVIALPTGAAGLWIKALSWSCHQRRSVVPFAMLGPFLSNQDEANALVEAELWHEVDNGWEIHDWADYQEKSLSEKRADAGRRGGKRSGEVRRAGSNPEADDEAGTHPIPSRPVPSRPNRRDSFDEFWFMYPRKTGKGAAEKAWAKAIKDTDPKVILRALDLQQSQIHAKLTPEGDFRPNPTTWLNQQRWRDEVSAAPSVADDVARALGFQSAAPLTADTAQWLDVTGTEA